MIQPRELSRCSKLVILSRGWYIIGDEAYSYARLKAAKETRLDIKTFPEECPWPLKDIFPDLESKYCK
jgi:hypothetical protein